MQVKRLFIVDAMAMAYRSFYAFGVRPMTTSSGEPTAAVFGSALFLNKLIADKKPDYLVIACDSREKTFRHDLYPQYKANRDEMPADLARQLPAFYRLMESYGTRLLRMPGMEADDLIGTLAKRFAAPDLHVMIVSGDKDFMQLVNDRVSLYQPKKDDGVLVEHDGVFERFGVKPEQVVDCLAIIGDASDNVPGVRGIGDKGAAKLMAEYGSLDAIYANLDAIPNKKHRECLTNHKAMAYLSRDLVTIKTDLALDIELEDMACCHETALCNQKLLDLFKEMEFRGLAAKIETNLAKSILASASAAANGGAPTPTASIEKAASAIENYRLINRKADLLTLIPELLLAKELAFDTETTGLDVVIDKPIGISLSVKSGSAYYVPLVKQHLHDLTEAEVLAALKPLLVDNRAVKVAHNLKFDLQMLMNVGIDVSGPFIDTMICDWLLDASGRKHGLDACCLRHLRYEKIPTASLIGEKGQISMLDCDLTELTRYACEDADFTLRLYHHLVPRIAEEGLAAVLTEIEMPLVPVLAAMESVGIHVDAGVLHEFAKRLDARIGELEEVIYTEAGGAFNINSPKQLGEILFEKLKVHELLGVKYLKKTKSGFSTDESVLSRLAAHPLAKALLEYRSVAKLKGTYVDALPKIINQRSGRIHTSFHQTGTATGRLSSSEPNLQNIPIRTELGQEIRKAFRPKEEGWVIVSADYSQIELRLLAHLADEKSLAQAFAEGQDIHRTTASKVFGMPPDQVDDTTRSRAKAINFGIIYGMGARRLAAETGVSMGEATDFIDRYFAGYPGIGRFIEQAVKDGRDKGYAITIAGRKRPLLGLNDPNQRNVASAENIAVNSPIQGSAADLIKLAMIRVAKRLRESGLKARLLLQVHDELVLECPAGEAQATGQLVKECMEQAMTLSVPLEVQVGNGSTWLEAH